MGLLRNIALVVLGISCITFIALFGRLPALRNTFVGSVNRILCLRIPQQLQRVDQAATGGVIGKHMSTCGNYLFFKNHPIVMVGADQDGSQTPRAHMCLSI